MNIRRKLFINLLLLTILVGSCLLKEEVFVITFNSALTIPFKIAEVFGKFESTDFSIKIDIVNKKDFIKFLNLSKYSVVIADKDTANKLVELLPNWYRVCKVAEGKNDTYYLLVKKKFILNKKDFSYLIKSWNFGVDELNDPAVLKMMEIKDLNLKFFHCKG
jgi:hypothetical protein